MFLLQTPKWVWRLRVVGTLRPQSIVFQVGKLQFCGKRPQRIIIINQENTHWPRLTPWRRTVTLKGKQTPRVLNQLAYTNIKRENGAKCQLPHFHTNFSFSVWAKTIQVKDGKNQEMQQNSEGISEKSTRLSSISREKLKTVNEWVIIHNGAACCNVEAAGVTHTSVLLLSDGCKIY